MAEIDTTKVMPFPEAGKGIDLAIRMTGLRALYKMHGQSWMAETVRALMIGDLDTVETVLTHSAMKDGVPVDLSYEDVFGKVAADEIAYKCLEAFVRGVYGRSWEEHQAVIVRLAKEAGGEDEKDPFLAPAAGLDGSSEKLMPSESAQPTLNV